MALTAVAMRREAGRRSLLGGISSPKAPSSGSETLIRKLPPPHGGEQIIATLRCTSSIKENAVVQVPDGPGDNSKGKAASRVAAPLLAGYMILALLAAFAMMYLYVIRTG
ncbi:hypothetical protein [Sphingomonas sp. GM_Shp_2]|jgi:hypothetical protein|uniref:hypothetical protein n=1 Tax=Sphingomonas sp. GM_Shp_2 TaxID=2937380 RepID=UPI00226A9846|nr:hypothetical protein [Sphingomonas sp. GM_Shp_2]